MKTIKVVAVSQFHGRSLSQSFRLPAEEGVVFFRRCPNACDDKKVDGVQVHCGCGWPVSRTFWEAPKGWHVTASWTSHGWWNFPRGCNIAIELSRIPFV